jgi:hypothetical protein
MLGLRLLVVSLALLFVAPLPVLSDEEGQAGIFRVFHTQEEGFAVQTEVDGNLHYVGITNGAAQALFIRYVDGPDPLVSVYPEDGYLVYEYQLDDDDDECGYVIALTKYINMNTKDCESSCADCGCLIADCSDLNPKKNRVKATMDLGPEFSE